ncbi:MAG: DUF3179 domain-containing (seleno)protein, partial [Planctomycetota bacterium]
WRHLHPQSEVLSLRTGHRRDYGEGVAYHDYFSTDELMFTVPKIDRRLKNKDEVLIVRTANGSESLAISARRLRTEPVFFESVNDQPFVVITDTSGANRVYDRGEIKFVELINDDRVRSSDERIWLITEDALVETKTGEKRTRLPAHRAFWFGWQADHPDVRLVD